MLTLKRKNLALYAMYREFITRLRRSVVAGSYEICQRKNLFS